MTRLLAVLVLVGALWGQSSRPAPLTAAIEAHLKSAPGDVWFLARHLTSGRAFGWRADEPVRTASTNKLPIMAAVFAEVEAGRLRWDQPVKLTAESMVSGSGVLSEFTPGQSLPLRDVVRLMIVVSDNTATNLVLDLLPADRVNAFLEANGFQVTRSLRKIRGDGTKLKDPTGWSAAGLKPENQKFGIGVSTSEEMVRMLQALALGRLVSREASQEMIAILKRQQYKDLIGRRTGELEVASKSGALDRLRSDVGIVYAKSGPILIAMTVDNLPRTDYSAGNPAMEWMGELARLLVEALD